jgi:hypothetical protein
MEFTEIFVAYSEKNTNGIHAIYGRVHSCSIILCDTYNDHCASRISYALCHLCDLIFYAELFLMNPIKLDLDGKIEKLRLNPDLLLTITN